jgi:hypothetical protein
MPRSSALQRRYKADLAAILAKPHPKDQPKLSMHYQRGANRNHALQMICA